MSKKRNVVLYLAADLVSETRELGFSLSKTFENHLEMFVTYSFYARDLLFNHSRVSLFATMRATY